MTGQDRKKIKSQAFSRKPSKNKDAKCHEDQGELSEQKQKKCRVTRVLGSSVTLTESESEDEIQPMADEDLQLPSLTALLDP